jgi:hypothetical protein
MLKVCGCIIYALYKKITGQSQGISWLKGSIGKYPENFVNDVSIFLKVVTLFLPIPIYYALIKQRKQTQHF